MKENAKTEEMGDVGMQDPQNISLYEMQVNEVIKSILALDDISSEQALKRFKEWAMEEHRKAENKIHTLSALIALVGGQDMRIMQLLNYIESN